MYDPDRAAKIDLWVDDFCDSTRFADHPRLVRDNAPEILFRFLDSACAVRGVPPEEIEQGDLHPALVNGVAKLNLPAPIRETVIELVAEFLEELESVGRLSGGRLLGRYALALREPYLDASSGKQRPHVLPAPKIGRNDPCPCGSGKKYKRCCLGRK